MVVKIWLMPVLRCAQFDTFLYIRSWPFLQPVVVILISSPCENHWDVEFLLLYRG